MKNNLFIEVVVSLALVALAILLLNPFHFWMPDMMVMTMLALTFVAFAALAVFVLRESAADEREETHKMLSGRFAFLAGSALLTLGLIIQSFSHRVDVWLVVALAGMVIAKIATRIYGDSRW